MVVSACVHVHGHVPGLTAPGSPRVRGGPENIVGEPETARRVCRTTSAGGRSRPVVDTPIPSQPPGSLYPTRTLGRHDPQVESQEQGKGPAGRQPGGGGGGGLARRRALDCLGGPNAAENFFWSKPRFFC